MRIEYTGDILTVRAVEDCIRSTRKYTKGVFSKPVKHPIQGEEFQSRSLTEYYEVYPSLELGWDMSASDAWAWVWGDIEHIGIHLVYNYPSNRAWLILLGGNGSIVSMEEGIPGFSQALAQLARSGRHRNNNPA